MIGTMIGIHAYNGVRQSTDSYCVLDRQKPLNPAMQDTADRTDLVAMALMASATGILFAASTGSLQVGAAVGTAIFLVYLLVRETTFWAWPDFSWGPVWTPQVVVLPPRRDPRIVVVPDARPIVTRPIVVRTPAPAPTPSWFSFGPLPSSAPAPHVEPSHGVVGSRNTSRPAAAPGLAPGRTSGPRDSEYGIVGSRRT